MQEENLEELFKELEGSFDTRAPHRAIKTGFWKKLKLGQGSTLEKEENFLVETTINSCLNRHFCCSCDGIKYTQQLRNRWRKFHRKYPNHILLCQPY